MGVLTPWYAHFRHSAQSPINTSGNFPANVSAESLANISHSPFKVIYKVSEPLHSKIYLKFAHFPVKIGLMWGGGKISFSHEILIFLLLGSPYQIFEPYDKAF